MALAGESPVAKTSLPAKKLVAWFKSEDAGGVDIRQEGLRFLGQLQIADVRDQCAAHGRGRLPS